MNKLLIATHNPGKAREIADLLAPLNIVTVSAAALALPEPEETGATFTENAILKAQAAATASGMPALADDSGLSVAALDGAPGIYSARWAGPGKDFGKAMERVWTELKDKNDHSAAFICVLSLAWPDGRTESFEGKVEGTIIWPPRGANGFGYDPIFVPEGYDMTFGEMQPNEKEGISHRARAFKKLAEWIEDKTPTDITT